MNRTSADLTDQVGRGGLGGPGASAREISKESGRMTTVTRPPTAGSGAGAGARSARLPVSSCSQPSAAEVTVASKTFDIPRNRATNGDRGWR